MMLIYLILVQVDQAFAVAPIDVAGNIDYKSLCYIITHGDEKEESWIKTNLSFERPQSAILFVNHQAYKQL